MAFHHSVHVLIWTNIAYYTISTLLCIFEVSYYTSRSLDVAYKSPEKLTTHTVLRSKHCGIRTSLDTASVSTSLESLLLLSMLCRTSQYLSYHFRLSCACACLGPRRLGFWLSSDFDYSLVSQASSASSIVSRWSVFPKAARSINWRMTRLGFGRKRVIFPVHVVPG